VEAVKIYPQTLIDRWAEQLRRDLLRIRDSWIEGYWDYNLGDTCTSYSHCPFIPLCSSASPSNWYDLFEVKRWNPLNRNPSTAVKTAPTGNPTTPSSDSAPTSSGDVSKIPVFDAITSL